MKTERVLSRETKIYHRPACRYARRIKNKNKMELFNWEAKEYGYRPCKCCNTMTYLYQVEGPSMDYLNRSWGLSFRMIDGIVYVRTNISCWKLVYSRREEKIALYHRNDSDAPVDFENPQNERYHRQKDCVHAHSISSLCKYIYEHDRYQEARQNGQKLTSFTSKRSRILAARSDRKAARKRLDSLFLALEKEHPGYKKLSFC